MLDELLKKLKALSDDDCARMIIRLSPVLGKEWAAIKAAAARSGGSISTRDPRFIAYDYVSEAIYSASSWYRPHRHRGETQTVLELADARGHVDRIAAELLEQLTSLAS
jgi:hypothetical protein